MSCILSTLRLTCVLLLFSVKGGRADFDDSTDALITVGQPCMNDTTPYSYHQSISAWYESFLKVAVQRKAWPVDKYADESDFAPVFELLGAAFADQPVNNIGDDEWAEPFLLKGQELFHAADAMSSNGSVDDSISLYILAYFPWTHEKTSTSKAKLYAWKMDQSAFRLALGLMDMFEYNETSTPLGGNESEADQNLEIPLRVFRAQGSEGAQAVVVIVTGLDHYYTYMLEQVTVLTSSGFTAVVVPMPGTADSPVTGSDALAAEEYWTSILDWLHSEPDLYEPDCISFWGISTGSYWAIRASRVEKDRLRRVISQGTASHYTFTKAWLEAAENLAYPASLQRALGQAFGYSDAEAFKADVEQFSLLRQGLLDQQGAHLIAVNGEKDTTFPIDDQRILAEHGSGALLRWFPHMGHNGEPLSSDWLLQFWQGRGGC